MLIRKVLKQKKVHRQAALIAY